MKISYSTYQLKSSSALGSEDIRHGALFRIEKDGYSGYSDLHPWIQFGDLELAKQIEMLKNKQQTVLIQQSLWLAERDRQARQQGQWLLQDSEKIRHNFLLRRIDENVDFITVKSVGFSVLKVKVGNILEIEKEIQICRAVIKAGLRLRLDFNSRTSLVDVKKFLSYLSADEIKQIEYIEDPCPFDFSQWSELNKITPLAIDHELVKYFAYENSVSSISKPPFQVIILKPAKNNVQKSVDLMKHWNLQMTITSYLDHPIGVAHALSIATELVQTYPNKILDAGCMTLSQYKENEFSKQIQQKGPFLFLNGKLGIGFDQILEQQQWQSI